MGKAKTSDRTRDIRCVAKLLRDGGYSYDQSKHLIAEARRRVGLTPPQRKKGSVDRLTREELEALRRAACLLSLRPLSIGRFERSSECEARSIRKTTARSISSLISAQSAGTTLCSTGSTSPDQSWSRRETPELYRIRLHVSACYPYFEYHGIEYSLRLITDLTLFRHLPMYLKERVYGDGSWLFADTVISIK